MKLSKSLLSAIMIGIAVQTTVVSCGKDNDTQPQPTAEKEKPQREKPFDGCPACGMG
jgi:hypothetical protein